MRTSGANKIQDLVYSENSPWQELTSEDTVPSLIQRSEKKFQLIYKHSETCGVCLITKEELEMVSGEIESVVDLYVVNVIEYRSTSNGIARELGIRHESPQVILLKDGKVLWSGSHWEVTAGNIRHVVGL